MGKLLKQVEPSTHLFAAVFVRPTARDCVQFELGRRSRYHLPLTAGMLRPPRRANMPMPHRLNVQAIEVRLPLLLKGYPVSHFDALFIGLAYDITV